MDLLPAVFKTFALKVKQYWNPRPLFYTLIVFLGLVALAALIIGFSTPWRLPMEKPPIDATPYPNQTPCPSPWKVC
jgi:hypothetical protein